MKQLYYFDEMLHAGRIVKTDDSILGYVNYVEVFAFIGISDFSPFNLAEGQEYDAPEPSLEGEIQRLLLENALLLGRVEMQEIVTEELMFTILPELMGGGL